MSAVDMACIIAIKVRLLELPISPFVGEMSG